jgi:protein involved in polysaccharide export with SLBB domain
MQVIDPWAVLRHLNRFFIFLIIIFLTDCVFAQEMAGGDAYKLGSGDQVRVTVYGENDLSSEVEVDGSGFVSLPLIGEVRASGLSIREFEDSVEHALKDGYLVDPRVSVEVLNYRPFYIMGEVNSPGKYNFMSGITVLNAVVMAGGYTYRARTGVAEILRVGESEPFRTETPDKTPVMPGDVIKILERYF